MGLLDSLLRSMNLLSLDAEDPRASVFASGVPVVPSPAQRQLLIQSRGGDAPTAVLPTHSPADGPLQGSARANQWQAPEPRGPPVLPSVPPIPKAETPLYTTVPHLARRTTMQQDPPTATKVECHCMTFTLGHTWPMVREFAPLALGCC